ncbi:hypothetical protein GCM10022243_20270 [Saccharothrix violaceirubra]|uniref:Amino acid adenylation domain-containing protein n=1 Tax=Saccharothrix violaceirubra TaxID=413306 RepID=A0A7W7T1X7_9PSEU|nr:non-ribosomal peptide synthetase [Saccharothrix violaceirubra]MBB4965069.1 amino acid adenylation domain-containing protein [Saccharothrix violaceirubra]
MHAEPGSVPALPLQSGMVAAGLRDPEAGTDVVQCVLRWSAEYDRDAYLAAWRAAVDRHPVLRTRLRWRPDGGADQVLTPAADVPVGNDDTVSDVAAFLREDRRRGVDPVSGPALRVVALPGGVVVVTFHHAILDGRSLAMLLAEIDDDYAARLGGPAAVLPDRPDFADYARWHAARPTEADERFWRTELADLPDTGPLPLEHAASGPVRMATAALELSDEETTSVRALAATTGVTVNTVVLAAWSLLLAAHSGDDESAFAVTRAARHGTVEGAADMIGLLIATTPLRLPVDRDASVRTWLGAVRARSVAARDHQLGPVPEAGRVRSLVLFEHREINTVLADRATTPSDRHVEILRTPGYAVTLYAFAEPRLSLRLIHDAARFPDWAPDVLLGHVRDLLTGLARDPDRPVRAVGEPRGLDLAGWNDTAVPYPADATIPDLFAEQVRLRPDADAVLTPSGWLSYAELDRRANRLAHLLVARGARPDRPVGVALPRGADLVVTLLAVLKAGAAYLPLHPGNPAARDAAALRAAGASLVVADRPLDLPATVVLLSEVDDRLPDTAPDVRVHPDGLAYVNHTSGSTGRPKGVAVPHRGVVRLVSDPSFATFGPGRTFLHLSATAFDLTTLEVWGALLTGGRVVPAPEGPPDPAVLGPLLREHDVSVLWLTAGLFHQLDPALLTSVDHLLAGGDVLAPDAVRAALAARDGKPVVNGYGPTENTTFTTCHVMTSPDEVGATVPIGTPIQRTTAYVLDDDMRPAPVGVPGELYTGGAGLARGYQGEPALTAAKFVPDPFGAAGRRLYRTGDRARWRPDGVLEFLGRVDRQVKVRGFLVEPAEVEAVLRRHAGVSAVAVVPAGDDDTRHLVAYVVGSADGLREHAADHLPAYLCPARYVVLDALPLNSSGKVDRAALPAAGGTDVRTGTAPAPGTQTRLAGLWRMLLGVGRVHAEDDFFAVGGNSLLAVRLAFRVREEFGVEVPIAELHRARTLAACAEAVDRAGTTTTPPITRRDRSSYRVPTRAPADTRPGGTAQTRPATAHTRPPVPATAFGSAGGAAPTQAVAERTEAGPATTPTSRTADDSAPTDKKAGAGVIDLNADDLLPTAADKTGVTAPNPTAAGTATGARAGDPVPTRIPPTATASTEVASPGRTAPDAGQSPARSDTRSAAQIGHTDPTGHNRDMVGRLPDHLVSSGGDWAVWRWVELRGTGFGIEPLVALGSPAAARAADDVHAAREALGEARWAAFRALRAVEDAASGDERATLRRVGRLVRKGRFAEARGLVAGPADAVAALTLAARAAERVAEAEADYAGRFEHARVEVAGILRGVAGDARFREAVAWQNPRALVTAVDALRAASPAAARNVDYRRWEHTVVAYLQRYCAKNDTIGFFGPVGWAYVRDDAPAALTSVPGAGLVDRRTVYLENWAVQELAEVLTTDEVRPWAAPRRMPFVDVVGNVLHVPMTAPVVLDDAEARVLAACDGHRRAVDIAAGLSDVDDVFGVLDRLRKARRIAWTFEVAPSALVPERELRRQVERIDDPAVRDRIAATLDEVERGRGEVADAVGDPDRLVHAIGALQEKFTAITGTAAVRRPGLFYAGRTVVHEECRRDLDVTLSPALLDTLSPGLDLVLEAARWFTAAGAALYGKALREVYRRRVEATGDPTVRLADFWLWANDTIFRLDERLIARLVTALQRKWADALGAHDPDESRVHYEVDQVRDAVRKAFATARPGWRGAVQHSPDVLIAAKDAAAVRAGDYHWVLGEVHPGVNTMRAALFVSQHPDPVQLRDSMAADLGGPRVVLSTTREEGGTPQRLADALVLPRDLRIAFGHDACGPDLLGAVPVGECVIVEDGGRLVVRDRSGRVDHDLVELLNEQIMAQLVQHFRLLPAGAHTPRVSLDRLVVARETWRLKSADARFAFGPDEPTRFLDAQAWRIANAMPRYVFVKSPVEHKPFYVDLASPPSVELFAHAVRALDRERPDAPMTVGEMLPDPDHLWLTDAAGNRHTAEFRVVAVDRRGWRHFEEGAR